MEWFTLDENLRREHLIEGFESFIWTERYSSYGDFQILIKSTPASRALYVKKQRIGMVGSQYTGVIETVIDATETDGSRKLQITGSFMERLLDDRVAFSVMDGLTGTPNWVMTGTAGEIARYMFMQVCFYGVLSPKDTIPFFTYGFLNPPGNIPESSDEITVTAAPDTLYNSTKALCDTYSLGFRLVRNGDAGEIYFEVYTGNDRTSTQDIFPAVIFDPSLETLENQSVLSSSALIKTVAYVFAQNGAAVVYAPNAIISATGSERRILLVNSANQGPAGDALVTALASEGKIALAAQRDLYIFDGQTPQHIPYVYGVDYGLGDLVEERNSDGFGNYMLVTEQIFVSDNAGERSYPTLTISQGITPGSWDGWEGATYWDDVDAGIHWDDL